MAKARLSNEEIDRVVATLSAWQGRLTWELLVAQVAALLGRSFTRQGLDKHHVIGQAYEAAKARLRTRKGRPSSSDLGISPELATALRRADALAEENATLKLERERFREKFATWLYNARSRGISESDLNRSLPGIDRDASDRR